MRPMNRAASKVKGTLLALVACSLHACSSAPISSKKADSPATSASFAPTAPAISNASSASAGAAAAPQTGLLLATRERAGAPDCVVDVPAVIGADTGGWNGISGMGTKIVFGAKGGLVVWKGGASEGRARPLGRDGRPTSGAQSFKMDKSFSIPALIALDDGFAAILSVFDVSTIKTRYFVQALSLTGEPRGGAVLLPVGDHYFEGVSEAAGGRFIVLAGPNQATSTQSAKALVVHVDASGGVEVDEKPLNITAPLAVRPAVSFAVTAEHWAMTVQVAKGVETAPVTIGGKTVTPTPLLPAQKASAKLGGIEALVVDGEMKPIRGVGAGFQTGMFSMNNRYVLRWAGEDLAVSWVAADAAGNGHVERARLSKGGQLQAASAKDEALKKVLEDVVSVETFSGGDIGTTLTRVTQNGVKVGQEVHLDRRLPDIGKEMIHVEAAWSGDRFVVAHEIAIGGKKVLRTAAMRCDGK